MIDPSKPFFLQALDALKLGDRRGAAALIARELGEGNTTAKNLPSVSRLAAHIGEINLAIEASRRTVTPGSFEMLLGYWTTLAAYGRSLEAVADIERQPQPVKDHPFVLHFRGTVATSFGRFDEAQELFRLALAKHPALAATWLSLAMIKQFSIGDRDMAALERLERTAVSAQDRAIFCHALGKALEDCGDPERAFEYYSAGAALLRQPGGVDNQGFSRAADQAIEDFTPDGLGDLIASGAEPTQSLFVTGLPRSGTTLTEQILRGHSTVIDGDEVNLFGAALIPTLGTRLGNALGYQKRANSGDPWGDIGRDYGQFVAERFRSSGKVVDKSLGQSLLIGLMLHTLPDARIAWVRRAPDDVAFSCFRTYFATGLKWTCSLTDIADYMRVEDRLFNHWCAIFPDRILVVPYEGLVGAPAHWSERLQRHFSLPAEAGIETRSREGRAIGSASVSQVRQPISSSRIGRSKTFEHQLRAFHDRYYA